MIMDFMLKEGIEMSDITIIIPQSKIIETTRAKIVGPNGQISIGREHAGKNVIAYVVLADERYTCKKLYNTEII